MLNIKQDQGMGGGAKGQGVARDIFCYWEWIEPLGWNLPWLSQEFVNYNWADGFC